MAFITCPKCQEDNKDTAVMCYNCFATLNLGGKTEGDTTEKAINDEPPPKKTNFFKNLLHRRKINNSH